MLDSALYYLSQGFSVIPIDFDGRTKKNADGRRTKTPLIVWEKYQKVRPTEHEIRQWWGQWPWAAIAIITGSISGLTVIDTEKEADLELLGLEEIETPTARSGGGGKHYYFAYDKDIHNSVKFAPYYDTRSEGGYIIAPPSDHSSGGKYEWIEPIGSVPLAPFPQNVKDALTQSKQVSKGELEKLLSEGVVQGGRNQSATQVLGIMLARFPVPQWQTMVWPMLQTWNKEKVKPPLSEDELWTTYQSICRAELAKRNLKESAQGMYQIDPTIQSAPDHVTLSYTFDDARIDFTFKDIEYGRNRALETDLTVSYKVLGLQPIDFGNRININSMSSRKEMAGELDKSFGKKYPWSLMLAGAVSHVRTFAQNVGDAVSVLDIVPGDADQKMLLAPFITDKSHNLIFGDGGGGKTFFCIGLAIAIATNVPYLGFKPSRQANVLFLDYEDRAQKFSDRVMKVCGGMEVKPDMAKLKNLHYLRTKGVPVSDMINTIKEVVKRSNIELIVIDSVAYACGMEIEKAEAAIRYFNALDALECATLGIAHVTKGSSDQSEKNNGQSHAIGSIFFHNAPRNIWNIAVHADAEPDAKVKKSCLFHRKNNDGSIHRMLPIEIDFSKDGVVSVRPGEDADWQHGWSIERRVTDILRSGAKTFKEIQDGLEDVPKGSIGVNLKRMEAAMKVYKKDRGLYELIAK